MMRHDRRGDLLVALQGACALGILWPARRRWAVPGACAGAAWAVATSGAALACSGALRLGRNLRIHPAPPPTAALTTTGVYALVRHPIYAGLLAAGGGLAVLRARPEPLVAWMALLAVLRRKIAYEELLLVEKFGSDYLRYRGGTPGLVPPVRRHAPR